MKRRALGRGLDALLGTASEQQAEAADTAALSEVPIDAIHRSAYQPRQEFAEEGLKELAASIRSQGVMQPIVLRRRALGGYEIIAGERRWRAARLAGLETIPAVVRDVSDERAVAMALIENIQREDLNPLEEALALQRLQEEFALTQQQVADAVGKSRVAVTNLMRLIQLSPPVREMLVRGEVEMGHARALLSLPSADQLDIARQVVAKGLSVRQTEALVRQRLAPKASARATGTSGAKDPDTRRLEIELSERLGVPVSIEFDGKSRGRLSISYSSLDELDGILKRLR
jgi:ParB family chromosome partitioning protein